MSYSDKIAPLTSPGTEMIIQGVVMTVGTMGILNYFQSLPLLSMQFLVPSISIGVLMYLVQMYLPSAEYYIESQY
jgi:hypothetical protein